MTLFRSTDILPPPGGRSRSPIVDSTVIILRLPGLSRAVIKRNRATDVADNVNICRAGKIIAVPVRKSTDLLYSIDQHMPHTCCLSDPTEKESIVKADTHYP